MTVSALGNVVLNPSFFDRVGFGNSLNCRYVLALDVFDRNLAGTLRLSIDMHHAGTALRDAASILCSGKSEFLANNPEQRSVVGNFDRIRCAVDMK
jgi:hypothetical protein